MRRPSEYGISVGDASSRNFPVAATLLQMLFVLFSVREALLGQAAEASDYRHELFHDGRYLLPVPCH